MSLPIKARQDLEDLWRERLEIALNRYREAKAECSRTIGDHTHASTLNGNAAFIAALRAENAALAEYRRVLNIFTDLTVSGIMPPE